MDTDGSGIRFSVILGRFWGPFLKAFWEPTSEIPFSLSFFPAHFCSPIFGFQPRRLKAGKSGFRLECMTKNNFSQKSCFKSSRLDFYCSSEALGQFFDFRYPGDRFENSWISYKKPDPK